MFLHTETTPTSVSFGGKSRYLSISTVEGSIFIYDLRKTKIVRQFQLSHDTNNNNNLIPNSCSRACFDPTDTYVAALSSSPTDGSLRLFQLREGNLISTHRSPAGSHGGALALAFSQLQPHRALQGTRDGTLLVYDLQSSSPPISSFLRRHSAPITDVSFSPDNPVLIASSSEDRTLAFHDVNSRKTIQSLSHTVGIACLGFYSDGVTVAAGTEDGKVMVYDLRKVSSGAVMTWKVGTKSVRRMQFRMGMKTKKSVMVGSAAVAAAAAAAKERTSLVMRHHHGDDDEGTSSLLKTTMSEPKSRLSVQFSPSVDIKNAAEENSHAFQPIKSFCPETPSSGVIGESSPISSTTRKTTVPMTESDDPSTSFQDNTSNPYEIMESSVNTSIVSLKLSQSPQSYTQQRLVVSKHDDDDMGLDHHHDDSSPKQVEHTMEEEQQQHNIGVNQSLARIKHETKSLSKQDTSTKQQKHPEECFIDETTTIPIAYDQTKQEEESKQQRQQQPLHVSSTNNNNSPRIDSSHLVLDNSMTTSIQQQPDTDFNQSFKDHLLVDKKLLRTMMEDTLDGLQEDMENYLSNFHVDMLRQFQMQSDEMKIMFSEQRTFLEKLVRENRELREENERLRNTLGTEFG